MSMMNTGWILNGQIEGGDWLDAKEADKFAQFLESLKTAVNELDVLHGCRLHKVFYDEITCDSIYSKNRAGVKQAICLFGDVCLVSNVKKNFMQEFNAFKLCTLGQLTHNRHAIFSVGYNQDSVTILTWGNNQKGTWAWWEYVD